MEHPKTIGKGKKIIWSSRSHYKLHISGWSDHFKNDGWAMHAADLYESQEEGKNSNWKTKWVQACTDSSFGIILQSIDYEESKWCRAERDLLRAEEKKGRLRLLTLQEEDLQNLDETFNKIRDFLEAVGPVYDSGSDMGSNSCKVHSAPSPSMTSTQPSDYSRPSTQKAIDSDNESCDVLLIDPEFCGSHLTEKRDEIKIKGFDVCLKCNVERFSQVNKFVRQLNPSIVYIEDLGGEGLPWKLNLEDEFILELAHFLGNGKVDEGPWDHWRGCMLNLGKTQREIMNKLCNKQPGKLSVLTWAEHPDKPDREQLWDLFSDYLDRNRYEQNKQDAFAQACDKAISFFEPDRLILAPARPVAPSAQAKQTRRNWHPHRKLICRLEGGDAPTIAHELTAADPRITASLEVKMIVQPDVEEAHVKNADEPILRELENNLKEVVGEKVDFRATGSLYVRMSVAAFEKLERRVCNKDSGLDLKLPAAWGPGETRITQVLPGRTCWLQAIMPAEEVHMLCNHLCVQLEKMKSKQVVTQKVDGQTAEEWKSVGNEAIKKGDHAAAYEVSSTQQVDFAPKISKSQDMEIDRRLSHASSALELQAVIKEVVVEFSPITAALGLRRVAQLKAQLPTQLMDQVLGSVSKHARHMNGNGISMSLWSLATLKIKRLDLVHVLVEAAKTKIERKKFYAMNVSKTLWAFATLEIEPQEDLVWMLWEAAREYAKEFDELALSNVFWAAGKLKIEPPRDLVSMLLSTAEENGTKFTALGIANLFWGLAKLKIKPPRGLRRFLFSSAMDKSSEFKPQEISSFFWGLATLNIHPPEVIITKLMDTARSKEKEFGEQATSLCLWALAKFDIEPPEEFVSMLCMIAQRQSREFTSEGIAMIFWALATLKIEPSWELFTMLSDSAKCKIKEFNPQSSSMCLFAFAKFKTEPPGELIDWLCKVVEEKNGEANAMTISMCLFALVKLKTKPPENLVCLLCEAAKDNTQDFNSKTRAMISLALSQLKCEQTDLLNILSEEGNDTEEEYWECKICFDLLLDPVTLLCHHSHAFCSGCLERWYNEQENATCPTCRRVIAEDQAVNTDLRDRIKQLRPRHLARRLLKLEEEEQMTCEACEEPSRVAPVDVRLDGEGARPAEKALKITDLEDPSIAAPVNVGFDGGGGARPYDPAKKALKITGRLLSSAPSDVFVPEQATSSGGKIVLNSKGLPMRPGQRPCLFFIQNGSCGYGLGCKWHHPEDAGNSTTHYSRMGRKSGSNFCKGGWGKGR